MTRVDELENTQIYDFTAVERNKIRNNIVIIAGCHIRLEVNFYSILAEVRHFSICLVFLWIEVVSDKLVGDVKFIDVVVDKCVVCLTVGVNDSFGFCCNITEVDHKV